MKWHILPARALCATLLLGALSPTNAQINAGPGDLRMLTPGTLMVGTTAGTAPSTLTVRGNDAGMPACAWGLSGQSTFRTISPGGTNNYWHLFKGGLEVGQLFNTGGTSAGNTPFNVNAINGHLRLLTYSSSVPAGEMRVQVNKNQTATINGFSSQNTSGFVSVSARQSFYGTAPGAFTRLHLIDDAGSDLQNVYAQQLGFRPWQRNGVTFTGNSDQAYVGQWYSDNTSDFVLQWSDHPQTEPWSCDRMKFVFSSDYDAGATSGMNSLQGLEGMRLWPKSATEVNVGLGDFSLVGSGDPTERLDLLTGRLRIRQLPNDEEDMEAKKVMMVREDGVVVWRNESFFTGSVGSDCEWTMPTMAPNHVSTAYGATAANCPDEAEAVGIGLDLSSVTPTAKLQVETDDFTNGMLLQTSSVGTDVIGEQIKTTGGSQFHTGLFVTSEGGVDPTCADLPPADPYAPLHAEDNCATAGIRVDVTSHGRRSRGVWAYTNGATKRAVGGRFEARDAAEYAWGVMGFTQHATYNSFGVYGENRAPGFNMNCGTYGMSVGTGTKNYGAYGLACNAGTNYGVYGDACSTEGNNWAGWFNGKVNIDGDLLRFGSTYDWSDERLKSNVQDLTGEHAMDLIRQLRPKMFDYRKAEFEGFGFPEGRQMGLIAQQVKEVIPEMVKEFTAPEQRDVDGNVTSGSFTGLAVNYEALIPVLVAGMQEQQATIDAKQAEIDALTERLAKLEARMNGETKTAPGTENVSRGAQLFQNEPNPFNENTVIRYDLPEGTQASLEVLSASGQVVKTFTRLGTGTGQVLIAAGALPAGTYTYTLVINGQRTETKRMIITQ